MFCVIPFQKVVVHCLSAPSGFHSIFQFVKGTEIVDFSFECNLRLPFSAFCRVIHAGVSADVGGNGVAFLDASKIATDVPSHSFRLSIMLAACRQPQLFVFPACGRGCPTMVSLPQSHRHFQYRHHFILRPCVLPAQTGQPFSCTPARE